MMTEGSWTDWCFLILLGGGVSWILWAMRHETTAHFMKQLFHQRLAVSAGVVLLFYFSIAILDCIHMPGRAATVLDQVLAPLDRVEEKTFSAPLSLVSYVSEVRILSEQYVSDYPVLRYPARFFHGHETNKSMFVLQQCFLGLSMGLGVMLMGYIGGIGYGWFRFHQWKYVAHPAYKTAWLTLGLLVWVVLLAYGLSRQLHVFGTGKIGQDIFYYALKSIRTGLVISTLTTFFTLPFALILGVAAGYFGGWIDDIIQYVYTTLSSIPGVLLITASVLSMQAFIANHPQWFTTLNQQADARLLALCCILGVTSWTSLCRLLRAEALHLKQIDYVLAAQVLGVSSWKILSRHLLPNVTHIIMITLALDFSYLVLAEAVLTYVGVGVSPMTISWGNMINSARLELARDPIVWWPMMAAFMMMLALVLASNVFADAVERAWDPKSNEG